MTNGKFNFRQMNKPREVIVIRSSSNESSVSLDVFDIRGRGTTVRAEEAGPSCRMDASSSDWGDSLSDDSSAGDRPPSHVVGYSSWPLLPPLVVAPLVVEAVVTILNPVPEPPGMVTRARSGLPSSAPRRRKRQLVCSSEVYN
jgi:hypothetical protein